jgi:uncharacterized protein YukE
MSNPGAGEPAAIRGMALLRTAKATELQGVHATVTAARSTVTESVWSGKAKVAFTTALDEVSPNVMLLADGLDAQAAALMTYAGEVAQIQDEQLRLQARRDHAQDALNAAQRSRVSQLEQGMMLLGGDEGLAALARARRVDDTIAAETSLLRQVQAEWDQLVVRRERVDNRCVAALTGPEALGKTAPFLGTGVTSATPKRLLQMLDGLSATDLAIVLQLRPDLAKKLAAAAPEDVAAWWVGMNAPTLRAPSPAQAALITALPAVIGNLGGVAYWARDTANRITLMQRIAEAEKAVGDAKAALPLLAELEALKAIERALRADSDSIRLLVSLTNDKSPLAAVAIGNLDTAANVTYAVPGMGVDASNMVGWADAAQRLNDEQRLVTDGAVTAAVVAWIGYVTPTVPSSRDVNADVFSDDLARAGAKRLAGDLAGWNAVRGANDSGLHVVAHSYGTTTSAYALANAELRVDSFVSLGSAGMPASVESVRSLNVNHMYVGQARDSIPIYEQGGGDQWGWIGRAGSDRHDPIAPEFGATSFGTNGDRDEMLFAVTDHGVSMKAPEYGYLDRSTESLRNIAYATTGQPEGLSEHKDPGLSKEQTALLKTYGLWALYAR